MPTLPQIEQQVFNPLYGLDLMPAIELFLTDYVVGNASMIAQDRAFAVESAKYWLRLSHDSALSLSDRVKRSTLMRYEYQWLSEAAATIEGITPILNAYNYLYAISEGRLYVACKSKELSDSRPSKTVLTIVR